MAQRTGWFPIDGASPLRSLGHEDRPRSGQRRRVSARGRAAVAPLEVARTAPIPSRGYVWAATAVGADVVPLTMSGTSAVLDSLFGWGVPPHPAFHRGGVVSHPMWFQL
jgi:hypothetical protein